MPKLVASSIPTITALREQLDYGDSHLSRCNAFYDDVRTFRKRYRTHDGSSGISLYNWKSPEHQAGLKEMTEAYLDKEGNGALYWPDGDTDPNRNKLRYSQDHHLYLARLSIHTPSANLLTQDKTDHDAAFFPAKPAAVPQHQIQEKGSIELR